MKKLHIIILLFATINSAALWADSWIYFSGTIVDDVNGLPVQDHPVFITLNDSSYIHTVYTNNAGIYMDSVAVNPEGTGTAEVTVYDCEQLPHTVQFDEPDTLNTADFTICVFNNNCQAFFTFEPDSVNPYLVNFYNLSQGNYSSLLWEFGDGSGSQEINPIHEFNASGAYQVCLTIQDSTGDCNDTFCLYLQFGDTICNADFYWQPDGSDPLLIHFLDNSTGHVTDFFWDFGDNQQSTEQFPDHLYAEAGQYLVSLMISDSSGTCSDSISKLVEVGNENQCVADFTYQADTMNKTPNVYQFTDMSQGSPQYWLWDFGDGEVSFEQDPVHTYLQEGIYQVCLTISDNNVSGDCYDTVCKSITTLQYFNFGGQVFIGDYPLNIEESDSANRAIAYLYRKYLNKWELMDSREFWKFGYYWFADKPEGEYLVRADLLPGSADFGAYSPVYYKNAKFWTQADIFNLDDGEAFDVNLSLNPVAVNSSGIGAISGWLQPGTGCPEDAKTGNQLIYLMNDTYHVLDYTYTNETSAFSFGSLDFGNYLVKAETTGKLSVSADVAITENNPTVSQLILEMDCNSYVSVGEHNENRDHLLISNLYPQPAHHDLVVEMSVKKSAKLNVEIINTNGSICYRNIQAIPESKHQINLDVSSFSPGLYLLKVDDLNQRSSVIKKFIIQ